MRNEFSSIAWFGVGVAAGIGVLVAGSRMTQSEENIRELSARVQATQYDLSNRMQATQYDVRQIREDDAAQKRKTEQLLANAEIARAAAIQEKARGDAFESLLGMMMGGNVPQPFKLPVPPPPADLIPKQNLPTKPID